MRRRARRRRRTRARSDGRPARAWASCRRVRRPAWPGGTPPSRRSGPRPVNRSASASTEGMCIGRDASSARSRCSARTPSPRAVSAPARSTSTIARASSSSIRRSASGTRLARGLERHRRRAVITGVAEPAAGLDQQRRLVGAGRQRVGVAQQRRRVRERVGVVLGVPHQPLERGRVVGSVGEQLAQHLRRGGAIAARILEHRREPPAQRGELVGSAPRSSASAMPSCSSLAASRPRPSRASTLA